jgi:hypothetical protein
MVSWTKGIGDWWRDVMASWRQRSGGGGLPQRGEKLCKGRNLRPPVAFIVGGERERGEVVPHVGDKVLTLTRTAAPWHMPVSSVLGC